MALPAPTIDSTVLVTGASSGIGVELARELAARGHHVTLTARRSDRLEALAAELGRERAATAPCDLADAAARDALAERLLAGERDVTGVCNNAGFGSYGLLHRLPAEGEIEMVRLNCETLLALTRAFLEPMVERGTGGVLNVASLAGNQPIPGMATYAATKAFVVALSEAVHAELAGTGVSVTVLSPGPTRTEFGRRAGLRHSRPGTPAAVHLDAREVARAGVDGMVSGARSVTPGLRNRGAALGGRLVPRRVYLPLAKRVWADRMR